VQRREITLAIGLLGAAIVVLKPFTLWAFVGVLLFFGALAAYVIQTPAPNRLRALLLLGSVPTALVMVAVALPSPSSRQLNAFVHDPGDVADAMVQMARDSLNGLSILGLALLAGLGCLLAAVASLPRKRNASTLGAFAALVLIVAFLTGVSLISLEPAVLLAALAVAAAAAIALIGTQRGPAGYVIAAGALLLAGNAAGNLVSAADSARLAAGNAVGNTAFLSPAMTATTPQFDLISLVMLSGLLLIVLGCLPPRRRKAEPVVTA
jgi:hypothetical protein